jgi:hypothetical protein
MGYCRHNRELALDNAGVGAFCLRRLDERQLFVRDAAAHRPLP